jgi:hypothetical protein
MAQALGPIDIARIAVDSSDCSYIVLEIENSGSSGRWSQQFPSLNPDELEALSTQTATFLEYATRGEAIAAFHTLTADCADGDIGDVVTGRITLVSPTFDHRIADVATWRLEDQTRPVWQGRGWKDEQIVDRI